MRSCVSIYPLLIISYYLSIPCYLSPAIYPLLSITFYLPPSIYPLLPHPYSMQPQAGCLPNLAINRTLIITQNSSLNKFTLKITHPEHLSSLGADPLSKRDLGEEDRAVDPQRSRSVACSAVLHPQNRAHSLVLHHAAQKGVPWPVGVAHVVETGLESRRQRHPAGTGGIVPCQRTIGSVAGCGQVPSCCQRETRGRQQEAATSSAGPPNHSGGPLYCCHQKDGSRSHGGNAATETGGLG